MKYFCGAQLASIRSCWASLRDNATPSALSPSTFYTPLLTILRAFRFLSSFSGSSKEFYSLLLVQAYCIPMLHRSWAPFVSRTFSLSLYWRRVRDNFTQTLKMTLPGWYHFEQLKFEIPCGIGDILPLPGLRLALELRHLTIVFCEL